MSDTQTAAKSDMGREGVTVASWDGKVFMPGLTEANADAAFGLLAENAKLREALTALYQNIAAVENIGWDEATEAAIEHARRVLEVG